MAHVPTSNGSKMAPGATILCNPIASLLQELPLCASAASNVCCLRCTQTKGMLHANTKATKYGAVGAAVCRLHPSCLGCRGTREIWWSEKKKNSILEHFPGEEESQGSVSGRALS